MNTVNEMEHQDGSAHVTGDENKPKGINWRRGIEGLVLCWIAWVLLFPYSSFIGLSALGVGTLMVGFAFGRD